MTVRRSLVHSLPNSMRPHIVLAGRCNSGKSQLMNALCHRCVSLVSEEAGTTADPVRRGLEWRPLGPVLLIDTAGLRDYSTLGAQRMQRTKQTLLAADLVLLLIEHGQWEKEDRLLVSELDALDIRVLPLYTKIDLCNNDCRGAAVPDRRNLLPGLSISAQNGRGLEELRVCVADYLEGRSRFPAGPLEGMLSPGELLLLVMPQDSAAPRGRLIMPQARTIRDTLDRRALSLCVQPEEIPAALNLLQIPPVLVLTDSQALARVIELCPPQLPLTTFSVLFSRLQGDLGMFVRGARQLCKLRAGDRVLIAEACAHHSTDEDIARIQLPGHLLKHCGSLEIDHCRGHDFPASPSQYQMILHCGGCVLNPAELSQRIALCRQNSVPITNFGMALAWACGQLDRVLAPFQNATPIRRENTFQPA